MSVNTSAAVTAAEIETPLLWLLKLNGAKRKYSIEDKEIGVQGGGRRGEKEKPF